MAEPAGVGYRTPPKATRWNPGNQVTQRAASIRRPIFPPNSASRSPCAKVVSHAVSPSSPLPCAGGGAYESLVLEFKRKLQARDGRPDLWGAGGDFTAHDFEQDRSSW
jgi:hypothetical protein